VFGFLVSPEQDDLSNLGPNDLRDALEQRIASDPTNPNWRVMLAGLELEQGRERRARRHLEAAVSANPDNQEACVMLGTLLAEHGEWEMAVTYLETSRVAADGVASATALLTAYLELKRFDEASAFSDEIPETIRRHPTVSQQIERSRFEMERRQADFESESAPEAVPALPAKTVHEEITEDEVTTQLKNDVASPTTMPDIELVDPQTKIEDPIPESPKQGKDESREQPEPDLDAEGSTVLESVEIPDDPISDNMIDDTPAPPVLEPRAGANQSENDGPLATDPQESLPPPAEDRVATGQKSLEPMSHNTLQNELQEARTFLVGGSIGEAYRRARKLADSYPSWRDAQLFAAETSVRLSRWETAAQYFDRAGEIPESRPDLQFLLAVTLYETEQFEAATEALSACLSTVERTPFVNEYAQKILAAVQQ
jgi:thioredoxin-like negative regulator of GroEL